MNTPVQWTSTKLVAALIAAGVLGGVGATAGKLERVPATETDAKGAVQKPHTSGLGYALITIYLILALAAEADQPEQQRAGRIEQPDDRRRHFRQPHHRRRDDRGDRLG